MSGESNVVEDELAAARHEIKRLGEELTSSNINLVSTGNVSNTRRLQIQEHAKENVRMKKEIERLVVLKDVPEMFDRYIESIRNNLRRFQELINEVGHELDEYEDKRPTPKGEADKE